MITIGGGSIFKNGIYNQVTAALSGRQWVEFKGIEANPDYDTLCRAVDLARSEKVDFLLAVGGGSVIDGTKFIATALRYNGGEAWDILLNPSLAVDAIDFGAVLTLPATGSEMNSGAVISRRERAEKFAFHNDKAFPQFSILDPTAIYSLPKTQISNGIVDTFAHTLEQYLTLGNGRSMVMDRFAEGLMQTLVELAPELMAAEVSYDAAANFMLTATMGLNGFISMGVVEDWATHMIGHELTALHGLDHAATLAIIHPALMDVVRKEKHDKLVQYALRVWGINDGSPDQRIDRAIQATEAFYRSIGMLTRLSEHNIGEQTIAEIERRFTLRGWKIGERGIITVDKVGAILRRAL